MTSRHLWGHYQSFGEGARRPLGGPGSLSPLPRPQPAFPGQPEQAGRTSPQVLRPLLLPPWPSSVPSSFTPLSTSGLVHIYRHFPGLPHAHSWAGQPLSGFVLVHEPQGLSRGALGTPSPWAPSLPLRAELSALRAGRAELPLWAELGHQGTPRVTRNRHRPGRVCPCCAPSPAPGTEVQEGPIGGQLLTRCCGAERP